MRKLFPKAPVLEIGGGQRPYPQSDILVDLHIQDDFQRGGKLKTDGRPLIVANIESLPFKDKVFGYSIASQVIEHTDNICSALSELQRVSVAGYFETPSALLEFIEPHRNYHLWFIKWENNNLTLIRKKESGIFKHSIADKLFKQNFGFRLFKAANLKLLITSVYWKNKIDFHIENRNFHPDEYLQFIPQGMGQFIICFLDTFIRVLSRKVANLLYPLYRLRKPQPWKIIICSRCGGDIKIDHDKLICSKCNGYFPVKNNIYYMLPEHFVGMHT